MLKVLLSVAILFTFSFGEDEEKTKIPKTKEKFAQELKQLIKKKKEKKMDIGKDKPDYYDAPRHKERTIVGMILGNEEIYGDLKQGKELYNKSCYRCHGKKAEKSTYMSARVLSTLTKDQLYDAIKAYKTDGNYGGTAKMVMRSQAVGLTDDNIASLATYIYSLNHSKKEAMRPINEQEEDSSKKQGIQGTYLK